MTAIDEDALRHAAYDEQIAQAFVTAIDAVKENCLVFIERRDAALVDFAAQAVRKSLEAHIKSGAHLSERAGRIRGFSVAAERSRMGRGR